MRTRATTSSFAMRNFEYARARFVQRLTSVGFSATPALMPALAAKPDFAPRASALASRPPASAPAIYVVDDLPRLTELYAILLSDTTYVVKTFNERGRALAALEGDQAPALLITDYAGSTMPVGRFIQACRRVHPGLRIQMASGFDPAQMQFSTCKPDLFLQKPFTPQEFRQAITAVLK